MNLNQKVVVEVAKNSRLKYELDKKTGKLILDRVLHGSCCYPQNYGYIDGTMDGDGDPLDVVVISQETYHLGVELPVRIIGAMKMIDNGERDTKLIGVVSVDPRYREWKNLKDVPKGIIDEIHDFFSHYKKLENKEVVINGFVEDLEEVKGIIRDGFDLYKKNKY